MRHRDDMGAKRAAALCAAMAAGASVARALAEGDVLGKDYSRLYVETLSIMPALTMLVLLTFIVSIDPYIRRSLKRNMQLIIAAVLSLVAQNYLEYKLAVGPVHWLPRTLMAIYGYSIRPVILVLFYRLFMPNKRFTWAWALVGVNAAVHLTALFSHLCFWIDPQNHYQAGPLHNMCLYVSAILILYLIYTTLRVFRPQSRRESWVPIMVPLIIFGSIALDKRVFTFDPPVSCLTIAVVITCVAYYIWLHLQFVREHEQALVAGQRVQLMLSQIKPHFLYNSLGAIEELCTSDPPTAKAATVKFARYLRGNMDSIGQEGEIPFERELEHTRLYLELEQLRFEDALRVRYDITCTGFTIPPLTLEPLAENAVRHGVRGNPDGRGAVTIATREYPDRFEISVSDDGPGFDPGEVPADEDSHVGIQNVRDRLSQMCGGTLKVASEPGAGTTATIILPRMEV